VWRKLFANLKQKFNIIKKYYSQKVLCEKGFEKSCCRHYSKTYFAYHTIALFLLVLAVFFAIIAFIFNIKDITYNKLYYFVKDFDTILTSENYSSFGVDYSYENNRSYVEYKGGFATIGQSSLMVYSATGSRTGRFYHQYSSPIIRGSSKYLAVYDQGGNSFAIYNSFACLHSETMTAPIDLMEICDNGNFVIASSTDEYTSVLYYYNQNFKCVGAYYYTSFITAVSLSSDGEYMAVSLLDTENGIISTKILLYKTDDIKLYENEKKEAEVVVNNTDLFVVACGVDTSGGVFDKLKYFYLGFDEIALLNPKGAFHKYDFDSLLCYAVDNDGVAVGIEELKRHVMYIESYSFGNVEIELEDKPLAIAKKEENIFVLFKDCVIKYDLQSNAYKKMMCLDGAEDIIISSNNSIIVCYPSQALNLDF